MTRLLVRWLLKSVLLMFLVSALTFALVSLTPGDPARTILGPQGTQAQYEALRTQMGLDEPLHERYVDWLGDAVHGDLGSSLFNGESVTSLLRQRLGVTITLVVGGVASSAVLGIALGVLSARRRRMRTHRRRAVAGRFGDPVVLVRPGARDLVRREARLVPGGRLHPPDGVGAEVGEVGDPSDRHAGALGGSH